MYFVTRLFNLTILPIFTDESIYIYWAKVIESSHSQWFISLTDGKPPLLIWMISIFLAILPNDLYLVAGRLPAVVAGAISVVMIYKLAELLFEKKEIAIISALLYILFPFILLYDRMALFDPLLQSTLLSATYFSVKTAKTLSYKYAIAWGISLGLAYLSKPIALVFVLMLPVTFFLINRELITKKWKQMGVLVIVATIIAEAINNAQRVSSVYFMAARKNAQFQQPLEELIKNPFALTFGNLSGFFQWITDYYTLPILLLGLVGCLVLLIKNYKVGILLISLWLLPIIGLATIGREIFPRYILFTTPYFLIISAWILYMLYSLAGKYKIVIMILGVALVIPILRNNYYMLTQPEKASYPQADYDQLIGSHPSGYGIDRVYQFINDVKKNGEDITVVTQGTFGIYPYAFTLEYWDDDQVTVVPRWPLDTLDDEIIQATQSSRVLVILKEYEEIPENMPLILIEKIEKPSGEYPILLTELE
jgi:4-amino-4-deoxy-L-arabinose transferase-like glycosyltransferase